MGNLCDLCFLKEVCNLKDKGCEIKKKFLEIETKQKNVEKEFLKVFNFEDKIKSLFESIEKVKQSTYVELNDLFEAFLNDIVELTGVTFVEKEVPEDRYIKSESKSESESVEKKKELNEIPVKEILKDAKKVFEKSLNTIGEPIGSPRILTNKIIKNDYLKKNKIIKEKVEQELKEVKERFGIDEKKEILCLSCEYRFDKTNDIVCVLDIERGKITEKEKCDLYQKVTN